LLLFRLLLLFLRILLILLIYLIYLIPLVSILFSNILILKFNVIISIFLGL